MKILVTGGAGFIASHLVDSLISIGHEVIVVDNLSTGNRSNINPRCTFYETDIAIIDELTRIFTLHSFDVVYHHAAQIHVQKSITHPHLDATINILGTVNLLECMRTFHVRKIVYASSAAVYGTPNYLPVDEHHLTAPESFYGVSKLTPEYYIRTYSQLYEMDYTIFRYANVYGERQDPRGEGGVISIFMDRIMLNEGLIIYGDGMQTRDFIYVKDIVSANIAALQSGSSKTLNISCNTQTEINDLISILQEVSNKTLTPQYVQSKKGDIHHSCLSNQLAQKELNWNPQYDLYHGLKQTYQHILSAMVV